VFESGDDFIFAPPSRQTDDNTGSRGVGVKLTEKVDITRMQRRQSFMHMHVI